MDKREKIPVGIFFFDDGANPPDKELCQEDAHKNKIVENEIGMDVSRIKIMEISGNAEHERPEELTLEQPIEDNERQIQDEQQEHSKVFNNKPQFALL